MSFTQAPEVTETRLQLQVFNPGLLKNKSISGAQIEAVLHMMSVFNRDFSTYDFCGGFWLGKAFLGFVFEEHLKKVISLKLSLEIFDSGDQTGFGKSRIICCAIYEYLARFKVTQAVWVSCKTDLHIDVQRECKAIGFYQIDVIPFGSSEMAKNPELLKEKSSGILFTTYSAFRSHKSNCMYTILNWLPRDFKGIVSYLHYATSLSFEY